MTDTNKIINRMTIVSLVGNIFLTVFKFFAGIYGNSGAMVSDAIHSLSDVFTTVVAWIGTRFSTKEADKKHPYGHERLECVASLILGTVLLITACGIGITGIKKITSGDMQSMQIPSSMALIAAIISILTKEAMFWYTRYYAKKINSTAFMADAWHHRSDALSSIGALIGIGGAMLGYLFMDPLASILICVCILKVSYDILSDALKKMMDTSCPEDEEEKIRECILSNPDVLQLDNLQTRMFGNRIYVDAEIAVNGDLTLREAHSIAEAVHDKVEREFEHIKHIMIHVNPLL